MQEQEPIIGQAYVYFAVFSDHLTEADYLHGLGMEPDAFDTWGAGVGKPCKVWKITTPKTEDPFLRPMIRGIVDRLLPIKERLVAFKQAYPNLGYSLQVVLHQGDGAVGLSLDNDTLLFLGEIGATVDCDTYRAG